MDNFKNQKGIIKKQTKLTNANIYLALFCLLIFLAVVFSISFINSPTNNNQYVTKSLAAGNIYYVGTSGSDSNPGTLSQPWQTINKAVETVKEGDTVYIRGGQYPAVFGAWSFSNSGTSSNPITLTNYSGEQVVINVNTTDGNYRAFRCWSTTTDPQDWQTPKADFIRIIGTDVAPQVLSNGVQSKKGIVVQGVKGQQAAGIFAAGCDNWEVAGIDFVEMGFGIFTNKSNYQAAVNNSADNWYVHNNRVYIFYRESGMQFDGDYNRVENNEFYKVTNDVDTPYGCMDLNIDGHHNIIKGNILSKSGSAAACTGISHEWDLSDYNTVEKNKIIDMDRGIAVYGGDNNIFRNNIICSTAGNNEAGIDIESYDNKTDWPCDEESTATPDNALMLLPPNDPAAPDYQYYYNPRNCHSYGNQVYNNTIYGFVNGIVLAAVVGENTIVRNNAMSSGICYFDEVNGNCQALPLDKITADHNITQEPFGFADIQHFDFHLTTNSPLIDQGYSLGALSPDDYDSIIRPQGAGYDIGAYEYSSQISAPIVSITSALTPTSIYVTPSIYCLGSCIINAVSPTVGVSTPTSEIKPTSIPQPTQGTLGLIQLIIEIIRILINTILRLFRI